MDSDDPDNSAMASLPPVVLIGAASKAGRAIAGLWPPARIVTVCRGEGPGIRVADYRSVPAGVIPEGSIVVNCVGTPRGSADLLHQVNCEAAVNWATQAALDRARGFVQLSSLSVYGDAPVIDGTTPEAPATDYGFTKLKADRELAAIASAAFPITLLRIPMLFGDGPDKLSKLVGLFVRLGSVPRPPKPVERAMLSYAALAQVVSFISRAPVNGVTHAADPQSFSYNLVAERMRQASGRPVHRIPVPSLATGLLAVAAPGLAGRLFKSSVLADGVRIDCPLTEPSRLVAALDRLIVGGNYALR